MGKGRHILPRVICAFWATAVVGYAAAPSTVLAAQPLTKAEQTVCRNLRDCIDILRRHDPSEFDYAVLEAEFRRFGPAGRAALFDILESDAANPAVATMIAALGPLMPQERARVTRGFSGADVANWMPLAGDGTMGSRDLLLRALNSDDPDIQRAAVRGIAAIKGPVRAVPVPTELQGGLIRAMGEPSGRDLRFYLPRMDAAAQSDAFAGLLSSGDAELVANAYAMLYRDSPAKAFQALLTQMRGMETPEQASAVAAMLRARHAGRADGFYAKFASDISGDEDFPVAARAAGLEAILAIASGGDAPLPEVTDARRGALSVLVLNSRWGYLDFGKYLTTNGSADANSWLSAIWSAKLDVSQGLHPEFLVAIRNLPDRAKLMGRSLDANNPLIVTRFLQELGKKPEPSLDGKIARMRASHPMTEVRIGAGELLKSPLTKSELAVIKACPAPKAFENRYIKEMPFFEAADLITDHVAGPYYRRMHRDVLTSAHPTWTGWLAGYDGGEFLNGLVYFDNETGDGVRIDMLGNDNVQAIIPTRPLRLGEVSDEFWVVSWINHMVGWGQVSRVSLASGQPVARKVIDLPYEPTSWAIDRAGNLVLAFKTDVPQSPLRLSPDGQWSLACAPSAGGSANPAPN